MKKWSDLWQTPRGLLITIIVLLCIYGIYVKGGVEELLDSILYVLINKGIPIAIAAAIIIGIIQWARGKR